MIVMFSHFMLGQFFHCQMVKNFVKKLLFFDVGNSLSMHADNKRRYLSYC